MTEEEISSAKEMDHNFRELRLAEHAFFRETVKGIKRKHGRTILWIIITGVVILVIWGIFSCPWFHKIGLGLCSVHH